MSKSTFFRQSGWLMIANLASGGLMWAVHFLSKKIPEAEYGTFGTLLAVVMCIPALPLQMVFAQQAAQALASGRERELSGKIRLIWLGTFGVWAVAAALVLVWQGAILSRWNLGSPVGLWLTLPVVLFSFWMPMFAGLLQGAQSFFWMGWVAIMSAIGRFGGAALIVFLLAANAAGMMAGVLLGLLAAVLVGVWQTRTLWLTSPAPFNWRGLLAQVLPLMFGFGAVQFFFTADTMFVKSYFTPEETGFYVAAGTLARALMWLVLPLAAVMFPKIVHSTAKSEKSDLVGMVLLGTAVLAALGAIGLWLVGPWVVRLVFKGSYVAVASAILPWYAWAMLPLSLAIVLVNNLLARGRYGVVIPLLVLAAAYGFALTRFHDTMLDVVKTLGVFNVLLCALCGWFTWMAKDSNTVPLQSSERVSV